MRCGLSSLTCEAANMAGYPRNGAAFVRYFTRVDLVFHAFMCRTVLHYFAIIGSGFLTDYPLQGDETSPIN